MSLIYISSRMSIAVHCLIFIYEYAAECKVTGALLAKSSGCNPVTVRGIMSAMKKDGMISIRQGSGGAMPCCPPEEISLYRICRCADPDGIDKMIGVHSSPHPLCPVGRNIGGVLDHVYGRVRADLEASLRSISLKDIIDDYKRCLAESDCAASAQTADLPAIKKHSKA